MLPLSNNLRVCTARTVTTRRAAHETSDNAIEDCDEMLAYVGDGSEPHSLRFRQFGSEQDQHTDHT